MSDLKARPADAGPVLVDPRGLRFSAGLTSLVLAVALVTQSVTLSVTLVAVQAAVFAIGVAFGVRRSPYALVFAHVIRTRLDPPHETADARPPRFAQLVGLVFALLALAGFAAGLQTLALVAVGVALAAAFVNVAFGLCLGCETYLIIKRTFPGRARDRGLPTTEVST
ncbi:MAG: DUF4395 domain-containing protein [Nocardioidaceae bacterium]